MIVLLAGCGTGSPEPPEELAELAVPALRSPVNGARTGSAHVDPSASVARHPLRPRLMWAPVEGAEVYQIQIDDSCEVAAHRECELASPELDARVAGEAAPAGDALMHTPAEALPVERRAPVGRRYYWRVRACAAERCGGWSEVRYLDVGRLEDDYDGDGYADVAIGAPMQDVAQARDAGGVVVYYGSPAGPPQDCEADRCARIDNPAPQAHGRFGASVAGAGDLDGDGFADLVIGAPGLAGDDTPSAQEGSVFVYYGGPRGLDAGCAPGAGRRCARLQNPDDQVDGGFGNAVAGAGDIDADGFGDVIVGAPFQHVARDEEVVYDAGTAFVYYGAAGGLASACIEAGRCARLEQSHAGAQLGVAVAGGGDLDGDGYADVAVGSSAGTVLVFYGTPRGVDTTCRPGEGERCARIDRPGGRFGSAVAIAGDVHADGFAELLIGAFREPRSRPMAFEGSVFLYRGAATGIMPECEVGDAPCARIDNPDLSWTSGNPNARGYVFFGVSVAPAGDVNADGHDDVLIGTYRRARPGSGPEHSTDAVVLHGSPAGVETACTVAPCGLVRLVQSALQRPVDTASLASADANGDGYSDVVVGTPLTVRGAIPHAGDARLYYGGVEGAAGECAIEPPAPEEPRTPDRPARCASLPNPAPEERAFFGASSG